MTPVKPRRLYLSVAAKFTVAMACTAVWVGLSAWISAGWVSGLAPVTGAVLAWVIVILVAYLPGAIVAFLAVSLLVDRQPPLRVASPTTAVTVIIAARNEERGIGETIAAISRTDYPGPVSVILADNGSTDGTCDAARQTAAGLGVQATGDLPWRARTSQVRRHPGPRHRVAGDLALLRAGPAPLSATVRRHDLVPTSLRRVAPHLTRDHRRAPADMLRDRPDRPPHLQPRGDLHPVPDRQHPAHPRRPTRPAPVATTL